MPYTTVNKSTDYFNTKLYTGNGSTNAITGVGFQPDLTWCKARSYNDDHFWFDAVRGVTKHIRSNSTAAETTNANSLTAFGTDGFTLGSDGGANSNTATYASWNWKANGAGSSNTDGSTNTISTSVNTTAGFSISTYTGTGSAATIGHGLGVAPKMIIIKRTSSTDSWTVGHDSLGWGKYLRLDTTAAEASNTSTWNNTAPTSTVFSVNHDDTNANGVTFVVYCFAEKTGYSKFSSYKGTGNATESPFIYTGFKPSFVMFKRATTAGASWCVIDTVRQVSNTNTLEFPAANTNVAEATGNYQKDFLSNGFKMRSATDNFNKSGDTYIYMAFGQTLVGSNNIPCTAR